MSARAIRRLAAAIGPHAVGVSAETLVDSVIEKLGLKLPAGYRDPSDPVPVDADEQDITEDEAAHRRESATPPTPDPSNVDPPGTPG